MKKLPIEPHYGVVDQHLTIDDRLYEGLDEDFDPQFVSFKPRATSSKQAEGKNKFLVRKQNASNKFTRKEGRTLESLRRSWSDAIRPEEEKIAPLIADVVKVDKRKKAEFVSDLKSNMDSIEAFFLKEVAPVEAALGDALERARQTIEVITDSEVEQESTEHLRAMFRDAVKLKSFDFLCDKLALPEHLRTVLIEKYFKA